MSVSRLYKPIASPGSAGLLEAAAARGARRREQHRLESIRIAREVLAATDVPAEQQRLWAQRTDGASPAAFYRWRREVLGPGAG
jgi:hypothetical protein